MRSGSAPTIVLGVTIAGSLRLMDGFPQHLVEQGWTVHVVASPGPFLDRLEGVQGIHAHALPMRRDPAPAADLMALAAWARLLRRVKPDVVMVGTPKAGLLGLLAARLTGVPTRIYHLRGLRLETATGRLRSILTVLERAAFAASTSALSVSSSLKDRVVELGLVASNKVTVLGRGSSNGVDVDRFRPSTDPVADAALATQLGIEPRTPVVGYVGRIHKDKGLDTLVAASERLHEQSVPHQLLVIGRSELHGDDPLAPLTRAGRPVIVTGAVDDTAPYYRLMDVLCLPTLREGFPNVVLEAGASGVPVVTTTATGAVDSVVDGETGLLAEPGDADSHTEALHALLTQPALREQLGRRARDEVRTHFSRATVWAAAGDYLDTRLPTS